MQKQMSIDEVKVIHSTFDRDFSSLVLSTISADGFPHVSYAPFIKIGKEYYIIISEKAEHFDNLRVNPKASIMFIQDELSTGNVFFRRRLTYKCNSEESFEQVVREQFIDIHGELVEMLLDKMDFHIIRLNPFIGKIVLGPGKAYFIENESFSLDKGSKSHTRE